MPVPEPRLVWSSHPKPPPEAPPEPGGLPPTGQRVSVRRETQGRAGRVVTALWGFQASDRQAEELGRTLRKHLSCGGAFKGGRIELQGDQVAAAMAWLDAKGYRAVRSGG